MRTRYFTRQAGQQLTNSDRVWKLYFPQQFSTNLLSRTFMAHSFTSIRIRYGLRRGLQSVLHGSISYGIFLTLDLTCSFPDSCFLLVCWAAFSFEFFSKSFSVRFYSAMICHFCFRQEFRKANVSPSIPNGWMHVRSFFMTVCWAANLFSSFFGEHFESVVFLKGFLV